MRQMYVQSDAYVLASREILDCAGKLAGGRTVDQPDQLAVGGSHQLGGVLLAGSVAFEDGMQSGRFVGAADQECHACSRVQHGKREGEAVGLEFVDPVGDHEARFFLQAGAAGEQRCGVTIGSHAEQDEVEAGEPAGLLAVRFEREKFLQSFFIRLRSGCGL